MGKRSFKKYRFHTGKRKDLWSDRKKRCWKNNIIIDFIRTESGDGGKCDLERRKDMGKQKSIRSYLFLQRTFNQPVWKWCQFIKSKRVFKNASYYYPNWDQKMADGLIEKFELNTKQRINKMSKGMLSMVTIIVALASKADFTF